MAAVIMSLDLEKQLTFVSFPLIPDAREPFSGTPQS